MLDEDYVVSYSGSSINGVISINMTHLLHSGECVESDAGRTMSIPIAFAGVMLCSNVSCSLKKIVINNRFHCINCG